MNCISGFNIWYLNDVQAKSLPPRQQAGTFEKWIILKLSWSDSGWLTNRKWIMKVIKEILYHFVLTFLRLSALTGFASQNCKLQILFLDEMPCTDILTLSVCYWNNFNGTNTWYHRPTESRKKETSLRKRKGHIISRGKKRAWTDLHLNYYKFCSNVCALDLEHFKP